jgi:succinoglycan biosynthesis transport protein ExoP
LAAIGLGFGFMTATTIALFRDRMDMRVSDASHIQEILGSPSLAVVPRLGSRSLARKAFNESEPGAHPELIANPRSQFSESFRALRTAMRLSPLGREGRVIAVTSCQPREGKTTVSINMAVALAQGGKKVLLVDADMRLPSVQYRLRVNARPGLSEILSGQSSVNEAVLQDTILPGLDLIVAGSIPPLPSELLGSSLMSEIVADLRKKYDYVVFDTPPVLSVTDPAIVASLADGALLVVRQGLCTRRMLTRAAETLRALEVRLYGFVFNGVDFALPEYYGYSGYYAYGAEPSVSKN